MPVVGNASERRDRRDGEERQDGRRTYRRTYLVEVDDIQDGADTVLLAPGLPELYYSYSTETETNLAAKVRKRVPKQLAGTWRLWEVDIEYDDDVGVERKSQDPLEWDPKISWGWEDEQKPIRGKLISGQIASTAIPFAGALTNPAGEPIDPPPTAPESYPILTIVRNELDFNTADAIKYKNAVNEDPYMGAEPRQVLVQSITTPGMETVKLEGDLIGYYPVTYKFKFDRETHDAFLLNYGSVYRSTAGSTAVITFTSTKSGNPRLNLLSTDGTKLANNSTAPTYSRWRHRKEEPFAPLNLPQSMPPGGIQTST